VKLAICKIKKTIRKEVFIMGILDIFGWEDIRKQPAYQKGKEAIEMTENK
jgi:hypothetical protein